MPDVHSICVHCSSPQIPPTNREEIHLFKLLIQFHAGFKYYLPQKNNSCDLVRGEKLKKRSLRRLFVLAWSPVFVLFSFSIPAWADDTIKIGVVVGLTGWGADLGTSAKEGMSLAIEEINKSGGVLGTCQQ